jgi:hypothetical protein
MKLRVLALVMIALVLAIAECVEAVVVSDWED